jgi:hypothetical protein
VVGFLGPNGAGNPTTVTEALLGCLAVTAQRLADVSEARAELEDLVHVHGYAVLSRLLHQLGGGRLVKPSMARATESIPGSV